MGDREDLKIQGNNQLTVDSKLHVRRKRARKVFAIVLLSFVILCLIGLAAIPPVLMGDMVDMHVDFGEYYAAEDYGITSEKLILKTEDDIRIIAHEVYVKDPKAVVIFISGIHNPSVTAFFDHARLLKENGYASILYEMRAHGESEGDVISLGFKEHLDTKAVVEYIKSNDKYENTPIVVYGLSMGAATAINSIGEIEDIDGLVSISAYSSWEDAFADNMRNMGAPEFLCTAEKPFVKLYTLFKYGFDTYSINPKNEIKKLGQRPALIMHSTLDSQVPYRSFERIMENAPSHVETWVRKGDLHFFVENNGFDALEKDSEYTKRIIEFLDKNFS